MLRCLDFIVEPGLMKWHKSPLRGLDPTDLEYLRLLCLVGHRAKMGQVFSQILLHRGTARNFAEQSEGLIDSPHRGAWGNCTMLPAKGRIMKLEAMELSWLILDQVQ
jgi:hypothetical protein